MTERPTQPTTYDRFMGNPVTVTLVTRLGARLAITLAAELSACSLGDVNG